MTRCNSRVRVGRGVRQQEKVHHLSRTPQLGQTVGLNGTLPPFPRESMTGTSQLGQRYERFQMKVRWPIATATAKKEMKQIQNREVGSGSTPSQKSNETKPASMTTNENPPCRHTSARRFWNSATVSNLGITSRCCLTSNSPHGVPDNTLPVVRCIHRKSFLHPSLGANNDSEKIRSCQIRKSKHASVTNLHPE